MSTTKFLPTTAVKEYSRLKPWTSTSRILFDWLSIIAVIWLVQTYWSIPLYIFSVIWIGARLLSLAIILHEGVHFRLHSNTKVNEFIMEWFLAWPFFLNTKPLRRKHLFHHKFTLADDDPHQIRYTTEKDWMFPKTRKGLLLLFLGDLSGIGFIKILVKNWKLFSPGKKTVRFSLSPRVIFYIVLIAIFTYFGWWKYFALYWLIPLATWFSFIFRLREIGEHCGFKIGKEEVTKSRTVPANFLELLFLVPANISYHIEHHLYPSVPYYNLPKVHKTLLQNPEFVKKAHITKSYWGVVKECCTFDKKQDVVEAVSKGKI